MSIALAWLALAGFGNAIVWNSASVQEAQHQTGLSIGGAAFSILAVAYGLAALATCVGLWRMAQWAARAYLSWCCTAALLGAYFLYAGFGNLVLGAAFLGVLLFVLALGYRYIRRTVGTYAL